MSITKQILLTISLLWVVFVQAQTSTNASGVETSGINGSVNYTIGQVVYSTHSTTNMNVTEGVQQPYEISETIGIEDKDLTLLSISAFPNPTINFLKLKIDDSATSSLKKMKYELFDINGKLIKQEIIQKGIKTFLIDMSNCTSSTYLLRVLNENKSIKEFKIIKK